MTQSVFVSELDPHLDVNCVSASTELPVSFITPLADVHVYEKDEAKFDLEISREPKSFRWLKGSQELSNDDRFELLVDGMRHSLVVKSAKYEDEAKYMFEAEDKRTSGKLIIKGKLSQTISCDEYPNYNSTSPSSGAIIMPKLSLGHKKYLNQTRRLS